MIRQHNPDLSDLQLLLEALTETEKQLVLKTAGDLGENVCRTTQEDVENVFPIQDPNWNPNEPGQLVKIQNCQEWISKGMEQAIPKTINRSAFYAIKQTSSETPFEFLDCLRDAMNCHTPLDTGSEVGIWLISLFLGQSTGDIRRKLQKLREPEGMNLDEAWRGFST